MVCGTGMACAATVDPTPAVCSNCGTHCDLGNDYNVSDLSSVPCATCSQPDCRVCRVLGECQNCYFQIEDYDEKCDAGDHLILQQHQNRRLTAGGKQLLETGLRSMKALSESTGYCAQRPTAGQIAGREWHADRWT